MTKTTRLKDCPMCGNKAEWKHSGISGRLYLRCSQCRLGYDPQDYDGDLGTTEACWNKRVGDAAGDHVESLIKSWRDK